VLKSVGKVREIAQKWINKYFQDKKQHIAFGLPEVDDRYNLWRVPITLADAPSQLIGEVRINFEGKIASSTRKEYIRARIESADRKDIQKGSKKKTIFYPASIPNKIILGDAKLVLEEFPPDTAQLIITSPPYYNAKPESCEFIDYQDYLNFLTGVIIRVREVLSEGRFFIINVSPVLIRRTSRNTSSKRVPIPFDIHQIMNSAGFEFIDDIIWVKPEGAGWNLGRGRRFVADRQPLQYKPVSVTEYVLVYRKNTQKLIDWNIRYHYDKKLVEKSKILGDYEVTNVWRIHPGYHKEHPAIFPDDLIRKIIRYYSFIDDLVLDPFAGSGTVGRMAIEMERRFLLIDNNLNYFKVMKREVGNLAKEKNIRIDFEISEEGGVNAV